MKPVIKTFQYGDHTVTLETGRIARQATAAVLCTMDKTAVLCTVVANKEAKDGQDFFPSRRSLHRESLCSWKDPRRVFQTRRTT